MDDLISHTQAVLSLTAAHWLSLTDSLPLDLLSRRPAPDEWSALDCLQHLLDTEQWVFPIRLKSILNGQDFPAFDPSEQGRRWEPGTPPLELAAEFVRVRTASLTLIARLKPDDLSRTARHLELGEVTLAEMLNEWAAHDLMHLVQAERALMQPFICEAGPWRPYFVDHDAAAPKPLPR